MTADHDTLRRLVAEATPGPWHVEPAEEEGDWAEVYAASGGNRSIIYKPTEADAALIVAAVNALPGLLDELARLRKVAEAAEHYRRVVNSHVAGSGAEQMVAAGDLDAALRDWRGA